MIYRDFYFFPLLDLRVTTVFSFFATTIGFFDVEAEGFALLIATKNFQCYYFYICNALS